MDWIEIEQICSVEELYFDVQIYVAKKTDECVTSLNGILYVGERFKIGYHSEGSNIVRPARPNGAIPIPVPITNFWLILRTW